MVRIGELVQGILGMMELLTVLPRVVNTGAYRSDRTVYDDNTRRIVELKLGQPPADDTVQPGQPTGTRDHMINDAWGFLFVCLVLVLLPVTVY